MKKYACGVCGQPVKDDNGEPIPVYEGFDPNNCALTYCDDCCNEIHSQGLHGRSVTREMAIDAGMPDIEGWPL